MTLFDTIIDYKLTNHMQGESLLQIITAYCEDKNLDPIEIGEQLKKDKKFVELFKQDLLTNFEAKFKGEIKKPGLAEWI